MSTVALLAAGAGLVFVGLLVVQSAWRRPWIGLGLVAAGLLAQGLGVFGAVR